MKADLTNTEIDELDELLGQAPASLEPLDVVMLDGYLAAVAVQPRIVSVDEWLPLALDTDGTRWPAVLEPDWLARVKTLMLRRFEAIGRGLAEDRYFHPVVTDTARSEPDEALQKLIDDGSLSPLSRALLPWCSGFVYAAEIFDSEELPGLPGHADDSVHAALARVLRHLPPETDEEREIAATLVRERPLANEDEAIVDLVDAVADLYDLTEKQRHAVRTVQRDGPKIGRNDPCPCGSGKKFKQCHGKG